MSQKPPPPPGRRPSSRQLTERSFRGGASRLEAAPSKKSADKTLIVIVIVLSTLVFVLILMIAGIAVGVATGVLPSFRSLEGSKQDAIWEKDKQKSKDDQTGSDSSSGHSSHEEERSHEKSPGKDNRQDKPGSEGSGGEQSRGEGNGDSNSSGEKRAVNNDNSKADHSGSDGTGSGNRRTSGDESTAGAGNRTQDDGNANPSGDRRGKNDDAAPRGAGQDTVKTGGGSTGQSQDDNDRNHSGDKRPDGGKSRGTESGAEDESRDTERAGTGNNTGGEKHKEFDRHGDFFGAPATGTRIVYLLDCSKKMYGQPFVTAGSGLEKSLSSLSADQKFFVIEFADDSYNMFFPKTIEDFVPSTLENQMRVRQWLKNEEIKPLGVAKPGLALRRALALHPSTIFFLTHVGVEDILLDEIRHTNTDGAVINAFGIGVEDEAKSLRTLASQNNGTYRDVEVPK